MKAGIVFTFEFHSTTMNDIPEGAPPKLFDVFEEEMRKVAVEILSRLKSSIQCEGGGRGWSVADVELDKDTAQAWKESVERECAKQ